MKLFSRVALILSLFLGSLLYANATTILQSDTQDGIEFENTFGRLSTSILSRQQNSRLKELLDERRRLVILRSKILKSRDCLKEKKEDIEKGQKDLKEARGCNYNGMTFERFQKLRDLCNKRFGLNGKAFAESLEACRSIGRLPPSYTPPTCPSLAKAKKYLESAMDAIFDCGTDGMDLIDVTRAIKKVDDEIRKLYRDRPSPSNDPFDSRWY